MASWNLEHRKQVKHATLKFGKFYLLSAVERAHATNELAVGPAIEESPRANHEAAHADNGPSLHIASVVAVAAVQSHIPARSGIIGYYVRS
jgi:hypothetical protein